jgi:heterotetrameric sarcosine oxidase alpha subunit
MSGYRLPQGGFIDRSRRLAFRFDGKVLEGHPGDTLASALIANGVSLVGRSFKYHRPRGILTAGREEPNALVELGEGGRTEPNTKATEVELYDGLVARSQNRWPSLAFDLMAVNGVAGKMISAGFYYKTFMWPAAFWEKFYEPLIRRAAGLGRATYATDPDAYEAANDHCDVLVVGGGPAGLAAARVAGSAGARVISCERDSLLGGGLLLDPALDSWRGDMIVALEAMPEVTVLKRTNVFGYYDHNCLGAVEKLADGPLGEGKVRQRRHVIRAKQVVLATGATERLIAFPGNDRPGVMMAGAALVYLRRFGVAPGRRAVVFTNNDSAYATARALKEAGLERVVVVDARAKCPESGRLDVRVASEVAGFDGRRVEVRRREGGGNVETIEADLLCVSGGWNPNVDLASQSGAKMGWSAELASPIPGVPVQAERSVGAAQGLFGIGAATRHGLAAGREAARLAGFPTDADFPLPADEPPALALEPLWEVKGRGKSFVDLQHDVTANDIRLAHQEGFSHIEHAKRYTTHNMATDQGKIGGLVGAAILAEARAETPEAVGLPTFRPYVAPVAFGAFAGRATGDRFEPIRRTALHDWHIARDAVMQRAGAWMRPFYYPKAGEDAWTAILREARTVRSGVGVCDVSTLGKIDLQGPDAAAFLDRLYANTMSTLPVGRARYGLMLREDGIVFDDGTVTRLGPEHFLLTTTTGVAPAVLEHMEFHAQTVWPELDLQFCSVTDEWAQMSVAGRRSRETLTKIVAGLDLSNTAFPFMAAGEATIGGVPVRVFRISFSGELAYEVAAPSRLAEQLWGAVLDAGREFGIAPYGLEAMGVLRIEKGHPAGAELAGFATAADLGVGRMAKKTGDFVGRILAGRSALADPRRHRLTGIRPVDAAQRLRGGAHLVAEADSLESLGHVTSVTRSVELEQWIGLALLEEAESWRDKRLWAVSPLHDERVELVVTSPCFVDPENARVRA